MISRSNHRSNAVHTYQREQFTLLSDISDTLGAPAPQIVKTENTSASTCNIKSEPCIENETRLRETEGILKIEVPDNVRKVVIVKGDTKINMEIYIFSCLMLGKTH